jgi:hypothetical protein
LAERLQKEADAKKQPVPDPVAPVNPRDTQSFALMNGTQRLGGPYGSRLEAEADRVRRGYVGTIKPV